MARKSERDDEKRLRMTYRQTSCAKREGKRYKITYRETTSRFGGMTRHILLRWKCSIYKILYRELALFLTAYFALSILYR